MRPRVKRKLRAGRGSLGSVCYSCARGTQDSWIRSGGPEGGRGRNLSTWHGRPQTGNAVTRPPIRDFAIRYARSARHGVPWLLGSSGWVLLSRGHRLLTGTSRAQGIRRARLFAPPASREAKGEKGRACSQGGKLPSVPAAAPNCPHAFSPFASIAAHGAKSVTGGCPWAVRGPLCRERLQFCATAGSSSLLPGSPGV
jgi:hypothetical protein